MELVTASVMREIDQYTMETIGIPAMVLMENAGRAVAEEIMNIHKQNGAANTRPWLIMIGKGNNGGDGIVAARHLLDARLRAVLLYAVDPATLSGDAARQRDIAARMGIPAMRYAPETVAWQDYAGVVDGLLGTGTLGPPREPYAALIREANASGLPIVAIDIPSGLHADTGEVHTPCVKAHTTVALAFMKAGLSLYPGAEYAGNIVVRPIGIPAALAKQFHVQTWLSTPAMIHERYGVTLPLTRPQQAHKGTFGHVLVAAGSLAYSGAGLLAAKAAMRSGAGLVTWVMPETLLPAMMGQVPELMLRGIADHGHGSWTAGSAPLVMQLAADKDVMAIGPGLGRFVGDNEWLRQLWTEIELPLVLDADALSIMAVANALTEWPKRRHPVVLTPHPGEMARLSGMTVQEVQRDRIGLSRQFAVDYGVILVLKGARTVIALPNGDVFVNSSGNPGMATGGTGDVLTGIIAGLAAQGLSLDAAAVIGVYLHGLAGDQAAAARLSATSLLAGDIIDCL